VYLPYAAIHVSVVSTGKGSFLNLDLDCVEFTVAIYHPPHAVVPDDALHAVEADEKTRLVPVRQDLVIGPEAGAFQNRVFPPLPYPPPVLNYGKQACRYNYYRLTTLT
jgi:hypothetical protein